MSAAAETPAVAAAAPEGADVAALSPEEAAVVAAAKDLLVAGEYQKLRNYIEASHERCDTDDAKLRLVRLWEEGLYLEFARARVGGAAAELPEGADGKTLLSSSMRYKLRKKHPCPVALEQELRVKNARLPKPVHDGLNAWLKKHRDNPYPNKAEKEALSARLGITPQQVNRWFIQRRKMLRIRGTMYLGRGITDNGSDDDDFEQEDDFYHESQQPHHLAEQPHAPQLRRDSAGGNVVLLVPHPDAHHNPQHEASLLEKILSSPRSSPIPQQVISKSLCSGGSVEVANGGGLPLTPPPSVSGQSNPRSTPPEAGYTDLLHPHHHLVDAASAAAPLDLTKRMVSVPKSSPVILEPVSPDAWRQPSSELFYYKQQEVELDTAERDAVNALLTLSRAVKQEC